MTSSNDAEGKSRSMVWIWACGGIFIAIAGYFLFTEHRAHLFAALPWLLILACPLMHIFMHHGHGDHQDTKGHRHPKA